MNAFLPGAGGAGSRRWGHAAAAAVVLWSANALAQVVAVPSAHLNHAEGSVAWSPPGDKEWHDVQPRRVLKRGDRLWTDRGSRAEVQAGGHALRMDSQTQLVLENVSETATQLSLTQGSAVLTVTRVNPGDSFEVGTPNLAFRARQPGDYRIDVDGKAGTTRVVVLSGAGVVYGERGEALELRSGQRHTFKDRGLAKVPQAAFAATDDFDRWAGARRRGEPTVSMPSVAAAAPPPIPALPTTNGKTLVISGPASAQPGARSTTPAAATVPAVKPQVVAAAAAAPAVAAAAAVAPAAPLRVIAAATAMTATPAMAGRAPAPAPEPSPHQAAQAQAAAKAQAQAQAAQAAEAAAQAKARATQAEAAAQAQAAAQQAQAARAQQERQRAEHDRVTAARRAEEQRRAAIAAKRAEDDRRQLQARKAEDAKRAVAAKQQEQRKLQVRRSEEDRKLAQARRAADEKRLALVRKEEERRMAAARRADADRLAEVRKHNLSRLQAQAGHDEQFVRDAQAQARRDQQVRRQEEERRADQALREDQLRREEQARREEADRRQRQLADQWRRDQERREQEVWLRQQQAPQPVRPMPMGVPARRVS